MLLVTWYMGYAVVEFSVRVVSHCSQPCEKGSCPYLVNIYLYSDTISTQTAGRHDNFVVQYI